ncbi:hypothetical protein [Listeria innocua]|nr:hypothetical protein [Listeria innocua]MBC1925525.1 hypothetical protein [Listeria innocua]
MKSEYIQAMNQIKAPKALVDKTKKLMNEELTKATNRLGEKSGKKK